MKKVNTLALTMMVGSVLTACSTQQTSQQSQVAQTSQQSQVAQTAQPQRVVAARPATRVVKPIVQPKRVVQPKRIVKPKVVAVRARPRVVPVKAKPAVVKRRPVATRARVAPPAPKVRTVTKPARTVPSNQSPWQRRQQTMTRMQSWTMGGRSALRFRDNAFTFGLTWAQRNKQQYSLLIRNPLTGTIHAVLDQSPGKATLKSRGKVTSGVDAERLLQQQLGVNMPVNGMPYWIRGVMAPQYPVGQVVLDAKGRPKKIVQAGWVMEYFNYKGLSFDALPGKINISRAQERVNVRILAKQWKTR